MLYTFLVFLICTLAFLGWKKNASSKKVLAVIVILACLFSLLIAYASVSSVWVPHPDGWDILVQGTEKTESSGAYPFSKFSYPLYLNVYHSPYEELIEEGEYEYGQARFSLFLANVNILRVNSTFVFSNRYYGSRPLFYHIDFLFSSSESFYDFLIAIFTLINIAGAFLGIAVAKVSYYFSIKILRSMQKTR